MSHKLTITIETGNAAFEYHDGEEIARILRELAARSQYVPLATELHDLALFDTNGNKVGTVKVEPC